MCCLFGLIDYGHSLTQKQRNHTLAVLSASCEARGTDATGIAYHSRGKLCIYKRPLPAHQMRFHIPADAWTVMGHTRLTTQGSEQRNYNMPDYRRQYYDGLSEGPCGPHDRGVPTNSRSIRTVGACHDPGPCALWYGKRESEGKIDRAAAGYRGYHPGDLLPSLSGLPARAAQYQRICPCLWCEPHHDL